MSVNSQQNKFALGIHINCLLLGTINRSLNACSGNNYNTFINCPEYHLFLPPSDFRLAQDIDAKRVEAIQMAKIVPEPRFPRREQSETTHKLGVKCSLGHLFCFYTYNVNVLCVWHVRGMSEYNEVFESVVFFLIS